MSIIDIICDEGTKIKIINLKLHIYYLFFCLNIYVLRLHSSMTALIAKTLGQKSDNIIIFYAYMLQQKQ